jgi:hypothetical protein
MPLSHHLVNSPFCYIAGFVLVDADVNAPLDQSGLPESEEAVEAQYLEDIQEGDVFSLSELQLRHGATQFALLCITDPTPFFPFPDPTVPPTDWWFVGSVGLRDDNYGTQGSPLINGYNSENGPPYTLGDDNNGDYYPTPFAQNLGEWSVTCQAFCARDLVGSIEEDSASRIVTRTFTMNP